MIHLYTLHITYLLIHYTLIYNTILLHTLHTPTTLLSLLPLFSQVTLFTDTLTSPTLKKLGTNLLTSHALPSSGNLLLISF